MKTAIVYISNHGTSEKIAQYIVNSNLSPEVDLVDLRDKQKLSLSDYNSIILGCSIHAGSPQLKMKKFIKSQENLLLTKELGLFLCCMNEPNYKAQFETTYPENLRNHAKTYVIPGGEFIFNKMNFIEKLIVRKVAKVNKSTSKIDFNKLDNFIRIMFKP